MIDAMSRHQYDGQGRGVADLGDEGEGPAQRSYYPSTRLRHLDQPTSPQRRTNGYGNVGSGSSNNLGANRPQYYSPPPNLNKDRYTNGYQGRNRRDRSLSPTRNQYSTDSSPARTSGLALDRSTYYSSYRGSGNQELRRPRKVLVYCNGDQFFKGKQVHITPSRYRSFGDLLGELTGKLPQTAQLAYGVRQIFTPTTGRKVQDVSQLREGQNYVCAGFETFKPLQYGIDPLETTPPLPSKFTNKPTNEHETSDRGSQSPQPSKYFPVRRTMRSTAVVKRSTPVGVNRNGTSNPSPIRDHAITSPYQRDAAKSRPRIITVVNASFLKRKDGGGKEARSCPNIKVLLNQRSVRTFDQLLADVADAFDSGSKLKHIYSTNGKEIKSVSDLFRADDVFIGTTDTNLPNSSEVRRIYEGLFPDSGVYVDRLVLKWNRSQTVQQQQRPQKKQLPRARVMTSSPSTTPSGEGISNPTASDQSRVALRNAESERESYPNHHGNHEPQRELYPNHYGNHESQPESQVNHHDNRELSDTSPRGSVPRVKRYRRADHVPPAAGSRSVPILEENQRDGSRNSSSRAYRIGERRRKDVRLKPILHPRVTFTENIEVDGDVRRSPLRQISERQPTPIPGGHERLSSSEADIVAELENHRASIRSRHSLNSRNSITPVHPNVDVSSINESPVQRHAKILPPITNNDEPNDDYSSMKYLPNKDETNEDYMDQPDGDFQDLDDAVSRVKIEGTGYVAEEDRVVTPKPRSAGRRPPSSRRSSIGRPGSVVSRRSGGRSRASRLGRPQSVIYKSKMERQVSSAGHILERFELGRVLGDGNFAVVKICSDRADSSREFALKVIDKAKLRGKEAMIENEIAIMKECRHPNIVRLIEEYETDTEIYLVMELVKGGDLFDTITQNSRFSEYQASGMISDLASALFYLHSRGIVHRDLKPENVIVNENADGSITLKLADFGLAMEVTEDLYTVCGTPTYVAPEILTETGYGLEIDMWALGVILYILLCGFPPFRSADRRQSELFNFIKAGEFEFLSPYWDETSDSVRDLISRLLVVDRRERYTAIETLAHPFITTRGGYIALPEDAETFRQKRRQELEIEARKALEEYKQRKIMHA